MQKIAIQKYESATYATLLRTVYGDVTPLIGVNYEICDRGRISFNNKEIIFDLQTKDQFITDYSSDQLHKVINKSESLESMTSFSKEVAQSFARPDPEDKRGTKPRIGLLFTPEQIETMYAPLLVECLTKIYKENKK